MGQFTIFLLLLLTFFSLPSGAEARSSRPPQDACTRCHRILDYKQTIAKARLRYVRDVLDEACYKMDSKVVDICDDQAQNTTQAMWNIFAENFNTAQICKQSCSAGLVAFSNNDNDGAGSSFNRQKKVFRGPGKSKHNKHSVGKFSVNCEVVNGDGGDDDESRESREYPEEPDYPDGSEQQICASCHNVLDGAKDGVKGLLVSVRDELMEGCKQVDSLNRAPCSQAAKKTTDGLTQNFDGNFTPEKICQPACAPQQQSFLNMIHPAGIPDGLKEVLSI